MVLYQGRLIAAKEIIKVDGNDYAVISFLSILTKSNKEYDDFQDDAQANGAKYLRRVNKDELTQYVTQRIASGPPERKPSLSTDEQSFLFSSNSGYNLENESLIYESEEWIEAINQKPFIDNMNRVYDTINELGRVHT